MFLNFSGQGCREQQSTILRRRLLLPSFFADILRLRIVQAAAFLFLFL